MAVQAAAFHFIVGAGLGLCCQRPGPLPGHRHRRRRQRTPGAGHYKKAYDNNQDDFTDLPQTKSISVNPSFFYAFSETAKLRISLNTTFENRWGGDASLIKNNGPFSIHQPSMPKRQKAAGWPG